MRVLLDTNVLATGIVGDHLGRQTPPGLIWRSWRKGSFGLLISDHVLVELRKALEQPWFIARLDPSNRELRIQLLLEYAEKIANPVHLEGVTGHPADDLVLAAAVSGEADYLVTGDAEFRRVGDYRGVKIRTPAEFLSKLDAAPGSHDH